MTILTPKQENFCRSYIETGNASEAYRQSYSAGDMKPETVNRSAKELLDNPKIAARVAELLEGHKQRHNVTMDSITTELDEAKALALRVESPSAAVAAIMGKAKLHGLLVEKTELKGSLDTKISGPEVSKADRAILDQYLKQKEQ